MTDKKMLLVDAEAAEGAWKIVEATSAHNSAVAATIRRALTPRPEGDAIPVQDYFTREMATDDGVFRAFIEELARTKSAELDARLGWFEAENERLRAEVERLRAALTRLLHATRGLDWDGGDVDEAEAACVAAKEVLAAVGRAGGRVLAGPPGLLSPESGIGRGRSNRPISKRPIPDSGEREWDPCIRAGIRAAFEDPRAVDVCERCDGKGSYRVAFIVKHGTSPLDPCEDCNGTGRIGAARNEWTCPGKSSP